VHFVLAAGLPARRQMPYKNRAGKRLASSPRLNGRLRHFFFVLRRQRGAAAFIPNPPAISPALPPCYGIWDNRCNPKTVRDVLAAPPWACRIRRNRCPWNIVDRLDQARSCGIVPTIWRPTPGLWRRSPPAAGAGLDLGQVGPSSFLTILVERHLGNVEQPKTARAWKRAATSRCRISRI